MTERLPPTATTALRHSLKAAGFSPLPVSGKSPYVKGWQTKLDVTSAEIDLWEKLYPYDKNTGILTKFTPAVDIDITFEPAAEAVEELAREHFDERGYFMVRIGKAPKRAILLRTDEPFAKITANLIAPDESGQKIEALGDGQQLVVFGIHPDTERPYRWHGGEPGKIKRSDLPYVREQDVRAFLDEAVALLVEQFGFKQAGAPKTANKGDKWRYFAANEVVEGARNSSIASLAGHLLRRHVEPFVALKLLLTWNACCCKPPLDRNEVVVIVNSIAGRELKRRGAA